MCQLTITHYEPCHCISRRELAICSTFAAQASTDLDANNPQEQCQHYQYERVVCFDEDRKQCQRHQLPESEVKRRAREEDLTDKSKLLIESLGWQQGPADEFWASAEGPGTWRAMNCNKKDNDIEEDEVVKYSGVAESEKARLEAEEKSRDRIFKEAWVKNTGLYIQRWARYQLVWNIHGRSEERWKVLGFHCGVGDKSEWDSEIGFREKRVYPRSMRSLMTTMSTRTKVNIRDAWNPWEGLNWRWNGREWVSLELVGV